LSRLATSRYRTIETIDGAPLIGRASPSGVFIAAGFGDAAAFAMPAIARHLAGIAEDAEAAWLASHSIGADRGNVAEFAL
jgi:glycine/D-amino acid oxidase-like deaminating enzyme